MNEQNQYIGSFQNDRTHLLSLILFMINEHQFYKYFVRLFDGLATKNIDFYRKYLCNVNKIPGFIF